MARHKQPTTEVADEIVVIQHTSAYRGDHASDVQVSHVLPKTTTLEEVQKLLGDRSDFNCLDWVEIPAQNYRVNPTATE